MLGSLFSPAPAIARLPEEEQRRIYPGFRRRILEATFLGYAFYYFVRTNLPVVSKEMQTDLGYDKGQIGQMLAIAGLAYGIGKFVLGAVSDRSNPRTFMAAGLILSAICNFAFGWSSNYWVHFGLWTINGFVQGAGWPPCGRSLGHWYSKSERGTIFGFWNVAHNVGGGLIGVIAGVCAEQAGWRSAFFIPGILALLCAGYLLLRLRDTPQSVGLMPIEEYKNEKTEHTEESEKELGTRELLVRYVLTNKIIWLIAVANFFVYIVRYSLIDWGPTYLKEAKQASIQTGGASTFVFEMGGLISTLLIGWVSDKTGGRRGMVSLLCMIPIVGAFIAMVTLPPGYLWLHIGLFGVVGFFIYPPVMLLGVAGLDFSSKKAVGTAAGFIGLFGYLGKMVQAYMLGALAESHGWAPALSMILIACLMAIGVLAFTWNLKPKE